MKLALNIFSWLVMSVLVAAAAEDRTVISLNGTWQLADSVSADEIPAAYDHTITVPGLVNQATPAFPEVDLFASRFYFERFARKDRVYPWGSENVMLRPEDPLPVIGIPVNKRNYFWHRKTFARLNCRLRCRRKTAGISSMPRHIPWDCAIRGRRSAAGRSSSGTQAIALQCLRTIKQTGNKPTAPKMHANAAGSPVRNSP